MDGPLKEHPRGSQHIDYVTLKRVIEFVRNPGTFDPRFFHRVVMDGRDFITLHEDGLTDVLEITYDGPFAGSIEDVDKVRIRQGYWTWDTKTETFLVANGAYEAVLPADGGDGTLYQDVDFSAAANGRYVVYLTLTQSGSGDVSYTLNKSTTRPVEYVSDSVVQRVLGYVTVFAGEVYDWWQAQYGNVFIAVGGGGGFTDVEIRWYAADSDDYLVDNTAEQEGPTQSPYDLQRGRFWHGKPEISGTTLIWHKYQKCFDA